MLSGALRRVTAGLVAAALACGAAAARAPAQDSIAPPGAHKHWLPHWNWVLNHWFPYRVPTLYAALDVDDAMLRQYFGGANHQVVPPLADLVREQGRSPRRLVRKLLAPWRGKVGDDRLDVLRRRAMLTLTQGHLLQHMLFHPLHQKAFVWQAQEIFTVPHPEVAALLRQGYSRREIGARYGLTPEQVTQGATRVLRRTMRRAIRRRWTPRPEGRRYLAIQISEIPAWLDFKGRTADPQAPYSRTDRGVSADRGASLLHCVLRAAS